MFASLETLFLREEVPDFYLLLLSPDGYEATVRLRQSDSIEIRSIPICAMTASAVRGDREKW